MDATTEDLRGVVHTLCEQRELPVLVTDLIANYLDHLDLFKMSTISRRLHALAKTGIYRHITVDLDGSSESTRKASLLFRTLLTSQPAMQAIRTLSLAGEPLQDWRRSCSIFQNNGSAEDRLRYRLPPELIADLATFSQREIELYNQAAAKTKLRSSAHELPVWALYLQLLCSAPHVRGFSVTSDYFRSPGFRDALLDMTRQETLQQLQSCSMCLDLRFAGFGGDRHTIAVRDWDSELLMPLVAMPDLQSFAAVTSLKTEAVQQLRPGASMITRLDLHHYQIQEDDLDSFLAATPNLTYFKYHARSDYGWAGHLMTEGFEPGPKPDGEGCGLEPLFPALRHLSKLQELHLSHGFDEDSIHFPMAQPAEFEPVFRQKYQLSNLKQLHTLTIPYATLLGWSYKDCTWDWEQMLPPSLRHITLTDDLQHYIYEDKWTDEDLMPIITDLVTCLSERGNGTASFSLHLATIYGDFNKPVREKLSRICEARGVRCTIKKRRADRAKEPEFVPPGGWGPRGGGNVRRRGRGRGRGQG